MKCSIPRKHPRKSKNWTFRKLDSLLWEFMVSLAKNKISLEKDTCVAITSYDLTISLAAIVRAQLAGFLVAFYVSPSESVSRMPVLVWIRIKLLLAWARAEVEWLSLMFWFETGLLFIHHHSTNWIFSHIHFHLTLDISLIYFAWFKLSQLQAAPNC